MSEMERIPAGIVFVDLCGYSRFDDVDLEILHGQILYDLAKQLFNEQDQNKFLYLNTWGDGIVLVKTSPDSLASDALSIRDFFNDKLYVEKHKKTSFRKINLQVRIGVHYGSCLYGEDIITKKNICMGRNVVLPARIEPIALPGQILATIEFKRAVNDIYESMGIPPEQRPVRFTNKQEIELAKNYGTAIIYEMIRPTDTKKKKQKGMDEKSEAQNGHTEEKIPSIKAKKIKTILGSNPNEINLHKCKNSNIYCFVRSNSLCLISELARNSEAILETSNMKDILIQLRFLVSEILEKICHYPIDTYIFKQCGEMHRYIKSFFDSINNFKRNYPSIKKDEERIKDVLSWRTRLGEENINMLLKLLKELNIFFYNNIESAIKEKKKETIKSTKFINDLSMTSSILNILVHELGILMENRTIMTIESLKDSLKKTTSEILVEKLHNCIENLPHNQKGHKVVPSIWPEEMR